MNPFKVLAKACGKITRPAAKALAKVSKSKPEIFVGAGILMVTGSFVWVAVEAMKAPEVMTATTDKVKDIENHYAAEREKKESTTREQQVALIKAENKELRVARADAVVAMIKMFGGPVFVLGSGILLIIKGHQALRLENAALGVALKGTEKAFKFYRDNVIAVEGKEADQRYMTGILGETEVETKVLDECGNEVVKKETAPIIAQGSPWVFEYTPQYFRSATGIPDRDITHIKNGEDYFNRVYSTYKKHDDISMYEVLEWFNPVWDAIDPTGERKNFSRIFGWGHDEHGDDRIDLGTCNPINNAARRGTGDRAFLVLNCDGRLEKLMNQYKARYIVK